MYRLDVCWPSSWLNYYCLAFVFLSSYYLNPYQYQIVMLIARTNREIMIFRNYIFLRFPEFSVVIAVNL